MSMCSLLAKRISSHFFSPSAPLRLHRLCLLPAPPLLRCYLSHQSHQGNGMPFLAQYLVTSFGISPDRAVKISADRRLSPIKSSDRPEAVVQFLKETGLSDALVKRTISHFPNLLAYNVEKTLKPKVRELIHAGFSREVLVQLIPCCPTVLTLKVALSRLLFWKDYVGDEALLNFIQKNRFVVMFNIDRQIVPRMNLLKEYGLSDRDIAELLLLRPIMGRNLVSLKQMLELIEELGITRGCSMFLRGLKELGSYSNDKLKKNAEFYQSTYGWSKEELRTAFSKFPVILRLSINKIKSNMNFLVREAKLEPRDVASWPTLLGCSLEKRLIPRLHVLNILTAKGLKNCSLFSACQISEKSFIDRYIEPYKKDAPELANVYLAAFGRNLRDQVLLST